MCEFISLIFRIASNDFDNTQENRHDKKQDNSFHLLKSAIIEK